MTHSLNEIEMLCRKAARGAGYSWGLAEDAGRAARWLHAQGLPGTDLLAGLLKGTDGRDLAALSPVPGALWQAPGGTLCPIVAGAALCDRAAGLRDGSLRLGPTLVPALLLPFAAWARAAAGGALRVCWDGADALCGAAGCDANGPALLAGQADEISLTQTAADPAASPPQTRATVAEPVLDLLNRFAARTYAPATEASRIAGAGAGLTDND